MFAPFVCLILDSKEDDFEFDEAHVKRLMQGKVSSHFMEVLFRVIPKVTFCHTSYTITNCLGSIKQTLYKMLVAKSAPIECTSKCQFSIANSIKPKHGHGDGIVCNLLAHLTVICS